MNVDDAVKWAIAFSPGFVALFVFNQIVNSTDVKEFEFIFYLVLLTAIVWFFSWNALDYIGRWLGREVKIYELDPVGTPVNIIIGILVGITFGYIAEKDIFYKITRSLPIVNDINVTSRKPVSTFVFDENADRRLDKIVDHRMPKNVRETESWVEVSVEGGKTYQGWPALYSTGGEFNEVFLSPACVIKVDPVTPEKYPGPGILIFKKYITTIEFINRDASRCFCLWQAERHEWKDGKCRTKSQTKAK